MKKCAIILCGGSGVRAELGYNKVFYPLGQKNVLETATDKYLNWDRIVIVMNEHDMAMHSIKHINHNDCVFAAGGTTRSKSVYNGLQKAKGCDIVAIHDGARPFVSKDLIDKATDSAMKFGSGIPALKIIDSIKKVSDGKITAAIPRDNLYAVQTPQVFRYDEITASYELIKNSALNYEDDSQVYGLAGYSPTIIDGDPSNKKLTTPADFLPVHAAKIGTGFDVHQLIKNRPLILGGINIPHTKGLLGHSDADVLTHAIMDALLSSASLKDIGQQFPDTDPSYKNANSIELLKKVIALLNEKNIKPTFVSAVIIAQQPKIAPYLDAIRENLSIVMGIEKRCLNISATTTEFMGIVGEGKAIAASAVCLCD